MKRRTLLALGGQTLAVGCTTTRTGPGSPTATGTDAGGDDGGEPPTNWPMHRADAANTGYRSDTNGPDEPPTSRWRFEADGELNSAPAAVDGTLYLGTGGGDVYAITAERGEELWTFGAGAPVLGTPAVADGTVVVWAGKNLVYAVDAATGDRQWQVRTERRDRDVGDNSPTVVDGTVYVGGNDLYALDVATGDERWRYADAADRVQGAPAVVDDRVYVASRGGTVRALDAADGTELWAYTVEKPDRDVSITGSPMVAGDRVYVGATADDPNVTHTADGRIVALGAGDGSEQWLVDTRYPVRGTPATDGTGLYVTTVSPGHVPAGAVRALEASDGSNRWRVGVDGRSYGSPTVVDGSVYAGAYTSRDDPHHVTAFATTDGAERWRFESEYGPPTSPAVVDGTAFVGAEPYLFALA